MSQARMVDKADGNTQLSVDDLRVVRDRTVYERRFKRAFDLLVGIVVLVVASPLIIAIALMIRFRLGKGVFYKQGRVGADREPFTIFKFRTMAHDRREQQLDLVSTEDRRSSHKSGTDPRHTRLGLTLRRFSLDELPQLINVVRGEMSLVGPRPEVVEIAKERGYLEHLRHEVKPGMTGPFQVSELRLSGDLRDGLDLDADYVSSISFRGDLDYLIKTVMVMLRGSTGS